MNVFDEIREAFSDGKHLFEQLIETTGTGFADGGFKSTEIYGSCDETEYSEVGSRSADSELEGSIFCGDNLKCMAELLRRNMGGSLQLIYADPPFFSNEKYRTSVRLESESMGPSNVFKVGAYDDRWSCGLREYIAMLTTRFFMMKELLADSGCLWVHLDWHVVHYVKVILDAVFGSENFVNEVIWHYKSGGANKRSFARKHDTLLFYAAGENYKFNPQKEKSYNRELKPYRFKGVEEFCDDKGWYTMVNMKDVWNIDMVGRTSAERTGYATQKPEELLKRIVVACSDEGDICADFFAGSGTLGAACGKMNRRWIMCDESEAATSSQIKRLAGVELPAKRSFIVERTTDQGVKPRVEEADTDSKNVACGRLQVAIGDGEVELLSYSIDADHASFDRISDGGDCIRKYLEGDSLSLVSSWSVDFDYDGSVHRAEKVMDGKQRSCLLPRHAGKVAGEAGNSFNRISIAGYDVLGNRFFEVLESDALI